MLRKSLACLRNLIKYYKMREDSEEKNGLKSRGIVRYYSMQGLIGSCKSLNFMLKSNLKALDFFLIFNILFLTLLFVTF